MRIKIDFVSDVSCPWCIVGLNALMQALERLGGEVEAELHCQPFELNPAMPAEGEDLNEHIAAKYGLTPVQLEQNRETIRERGKEVGFTFSMDKRSRIYNTFDAHRVLHWAGLEERQIELKHALFAAYFTRGENPSSHDVLVRLAAEAGLDSARAQEILTTDAYAGEVRTRQAYYHNHGIHSVPSVILNDRHLIQGAQPSELFEQALRQVAASR